MQKTLIDGVVKTAKEVIEAIDDEKLSTTFKVIEGDITTELAIIYCEIIRAGMASMLEG
jgi:hypothetical protein